MIALLLKKDVESVRKWIAAALLLLMTVIFVAPSAGYTEDRATIRLARTIYTLAGSEDYQTKLAIGTLVMNRVADPWFSSTVDGVLTEQQQFPCGERYDEDSLKAAHAVINGKRTLKRSALYYRAADASEPWSEQPVGQSGNYYFYSVDGRI